MHNNKQWTIVVVVAAVALTGWLNLGLVLCQSVSCSCARGIHSTAPPAAPDRNDGALSS